MTSAEVVQQMSVERQEDPGEKSCDTAGLDIPVDDYHGNQEREVYETLERYDTCYIETTYDAVTNEAIHSEITHHEDVLVASRNKYKATRDARKRKRKIWKISKDEEFPPRGKFHDSFADPEMPSTSKVVIGTIVPK